MKSTVFSRKKLIHLSKCDQWSKVKCHASLKSPNWIAFACVCNALEWNHESLSYVLSLLCMSFAFASCQLFLKKGSKLWSAFSDWTRCCCPLSYCQGLCITTSVFVWFQEWDADLSISVFGFSTAGRNANPMSCWRFKQQFSWTLNNFRTTFVSSLTYLTCASLHQVRSICSRVGKGPNTSARPTRLTYVTHLCTEKGWLCFQTARQLRLWYSARFHPGGMF